MSGCAFSNRSGGIERRPIGVYIASKDLIHLHQRRVRHPLDLANGMRLRHPLPRRRQRQQSDLEILLSAHSQIRSHPRSPLDRLIAFLRSLLEGQHPARDRHPWARFALPERRNLPVHRRDSGYVRRLRGEVRPPSSPLERSSG